MSWAGGAALGVEIDPLSVGGKLGSVVCELVVGQLKVGATSRRDDEHVGVRRSAWILYQPNVGHCPPVGRDTMEVVVKIGAVVVGHAAWGATGQRNRIEVPILGRNVDRTSIRSHYVVVVDRRNTAEIDLLQFAGAVRAQPKEQSIAIDDKPRAVGSPVRCLEEQSRRLVDEPPLTGVDGDDEELGALARAKSAWHGISVL